jgi:hypothetical protein
MSSGRVDHELRWPAALVACLVVLIGASTAAAQQLPAPSDDPVGESRYRFGPLGVEPRFRLTNLGVDNNVFNATENEQSDFTFTAAPGAALFFRTGRGLLSVVAFAEFVYFREFETERSINTSAIGQYEWRFARMRPYVSAAALNTRQRPGFEIDARARHYETEFHGGADLRTGSKGTIRIDYRHLDYTFAGDQVFGGRILNQELNRTLNAGEIGFRQRLSVLTTWITRVAHERERFVFEPVRNADSLRMSTGFELGRFALIRGSAFVGYRQLKPADGGVLPQFSGVIADTNVSYTAPTRTRLSAQVRRDVEYSYDRATPYYLLTSWTASLTQNTFGDWDIQLTGGRDRLSYQAPIASNERTDYIDRLGGGIGYTLGEDTRISVEVNSFFRRSSLPGIEYGGIRAGISVNYGY